MVLPSLQGLNNECVGTHVQSPKNSLRRSLKVVMLLNVILDSSGFDIGHDNHGVFLSLSKSMPLYYEQECSGNSRVFMSSYVSARVPHTTRW